MKSTAVVFKTQRAQDEFRMLRPFAIEVVYFLRELWPLPVMEITRVAEPVIPPAKETGVHLYPPPYWAVDASGHGVTVEDGQRMADTINKVAVYGDGSTQFHVATYHDAGVGGFHMHIQARPGSHWKEV